MPRMIDLVRKSQMSANMMQAAARGALAVQSGEMLEILVHLALHNKVFGEQARMTLAGWDEKASAQVAADPATGKEVLTYLVSPKNLRPALLPALLQNPSVDQESLLELAATGARWVVEALLASETAKNSSALMTALETNPRLRPNELDALQKREELAEAAETIPDTAEVAKHEVVEVAAADESSEPSAIPTFAVMPDESESVDHGVIEQAIAVYLQQNQAELASAAERPFELVALQEGTGIESATAPPVIAPLELMPSASQPEPTKPQAPGAPAAAGARVVKKPIVPPGEARRDSTLQKIAKLDIKGRIALAMRGNKEERSILIRDSTKLVALAVLDSPKVSEGEVEKFALQKNVLEAVLRAIPIKRQFMKNYSIVRNLVYNPRTPLDLSLGLMKNLLLHDLKNLSGNKEVSDTIRKLALRMFKQKSEKNKD
jgi:hypothetical protein